MDLILWRHAEAEVAAEGQHDSERALTPKGCRQARRAADWLKARVKGSYLLLASPTLRTRQTADALGGKYEQIEALGPQSRGRDILDAAGWPEADTTVIVVGHRPGLNRAASLLLTGREREWDMKKGGLWWFRWRGQDELPLLRAVAGPRDM